MYRLSIYAPYQMLAANQSKTHVEEIVRNTLFLFNRPKYK